MMGAAISLAADGGGTSRAIVAAIDTSSPIALVGGDGMAPLPSHSALRINTPRDFDAGVTFNA